MGKEVNSETCHCYLFRDMNLKEDEDTEIMISSTDTIYFLYIFNSW
jgi:hypothetical protein